MSGELAIAILCFIDDCHWVGVVRWENANQVYFLYSDDLNNAENEQEI